MPDGEQLFFPTTSILIEYCNTTGLENIDFPLSRHQGSRTKRWLAGDTMEEVDENKMIFLVKKKKKKKSLALFVDIMECRALIPQGNSLA